MNLANLKTQLWGSSLWQFPPFVQSSAIKELAASVSPGLPCKPPISIRDR